MAASATPAPEPAWLAQDSDPVLAFLHRPEPGIAQGTAVLLCPPFGWEEMCSYRGRRAWAQELARAGYPCARLTLPGTGDSGGSPRDPDRLAAWTGAVSASAAWLREVSGARRVVALGIGLGGMLACLAAGGGAPIDDLVLWGVPARGRALLRELRAYATLVSAPDSEDEPPEPTTDGELELIGFLMTRQTVRDIEAVELHAPPAPAGARRRVLLLERDGLSIDRRLREQFEQQGADVTVAAGDGYGALMGHPQESTAPAQTIGTTIGWLSAHPQHGPVRPPASSGLAGAGCVLQAGDQRIRETALRFSGRLEGSFGILAEASDRRSAPVCAVWLNGGALHHIGPNRSWVEIARRWAARGVPVVRVDLPGLGESDGDDPRPLLDRSLYLSSRTEETLALLDQLTERGIGERFILGGLCSGAYWSLHAALADPRVAATMLVNLYAFFWSAELVAERDTERSLDALQGRAWKRLVRGELSAAKIRSAIATLRFDRLRGAAGHPVQRAQTTQIEQALDQLRRQRSETLLLFSRGEGLHEQLKRQGALDQRDRWPNLAVEQIPTRDHLFRASWLQRDVHSALDRGLDRVLEAVSEASGANRH